ncbi:hypothetical protein C0J52_08077 [Blattella germanica]|nr:hypothetical protein C0J52_08077 [Blattella germanica]
MYNFFQNMRIKLETALANENKLRFQREQDKIARETAAEKLDGPCNKTSCPAFAIGLVHVREQLSLRQVEAEALERKVRVLQETEIRRQRKRLSEQEELDKNRRALQKAQSLQYDLEQKIIDLEQEVHRLKQQLLDKKLQASEGDLRPEVEKLKVDLEESRVRDELRTQTRSPSPKVSSPVLEKLKAKVALTLSRLTEERQRLQTRVRELEEQLRNSVKDKGNDTSESMHMTFTKERAIWAQEKAALKVALAQAEADAFRGRRIGDGADTDDKVKHLFGKFLRAESYRKALVWQKRYLLVVLGGYQESEAITVSRLAQLTVAIVVIALSRMRYMVQRWRLGRRIGSGAVLSRGFSETALSTAQSSYLGPRRRGSSTSIHSLGASRASSQPHRYGPLSPPSRDPSTLRRWQTDFVVQHHMRSSESIPISSLRPSHVSEYVDRFDELQRRLGLSVTSPPP